MGSSTGSGNSQYLPGEKPVTNPTGAASSAPNPSHLASSFDVAVAFTLENEGGYSNDPYDGGHETNRGITRADLSEWLGREASVQEVKDMTLDTAKAIYRKHYWAESLGQLSQPKATIIFDWGVNHGPQSARMLAQRSANNLGCDLQIDGVIGPLSVSALNGLNDHAYCHEFAAGVRATYDAIIAHNPSQAVFRNGWHARAARLAALA